MEKGQTPLIDIYSIAAYGVFLATVLFAVVAVVYMTKSGTGYGDEDR